MESRSVTLHPHEAGHWRQHGELLVFRPIPSPHIEPFGIQRWDGKQRWAWHSRSGKVGIFNPPFVDAPYRPGERVELWEVAADPGGTTGTKIGHATVRAVEAVRVETISEDDAEAAGITDGGCMMCGMPEPCGCKDPQPSNRESFLWYWHETYPDAAWSWRIELKGERDEATD